jgi:ribosomal protein L16 Arg81 hydroxylase
MAFVYICRYDVFVIHTAGYKNWTVCHPLSHSDAWPNASKARLAQLHEVQIKRIEGK